MTTHDGSFQSTFTLGALQSLPEFPDVPVWGFQTSICINSCTSSFPDQHHITSHMRSKAGYAFNAPPIAVAERTHAFFLNPA